LGLSHVFVFIIILGKHYALLRLTVSPQMETVCIFIYDNLHVGRTLLPL